MRVPLFPIDQPVMPETRQIGRGAAIDALEERLSESMHQWMVGPRRIGKTSVAKAVLARLGAQGSLALDIDLSKSTVLSDERLGGEIARQARTAGAGRRLRTIIDASLGHPRKTMLIAANVQRLHRREAHAATLETIVALAIAEAEGDRGWL